MVTDSLDFEGGLQFCCARQLLTASRWYQGDVYSWLWYSFCITTFITLVVIAGLSYRAGVWTLSPDYVVKFFWIQFFLTAVQDSIWLLICPKTDTTQNHLEYTQWWKALWHCDFQLIHHADSSISFWCLLCHINYFRCVQYPDYIRAAFIYETAYFKMYNFFAQVMRVALTCIIGSVYSSRFLVLLLSAYSLSLWRAETTDFKDTFQDFRLTVHIMNRSIAFVLATWLIFFCISCAQNETVQFLFSDSIHWVKQLDSCPMTGELCTEYSFIYLVTFSLTAWFLVAVLNFVTSNWNCSSVT